jgi:hypothetical protein
VTLQQANDVLKKYIDPVAPKHLPVIGYMMPKIAAEKAGQK